MYQSEKTRAALIAILSNSILIMFKLIVGTIMHSVSVISEAVHSGIDLIASIIGWLSVKESIKPADDEHRFGHGKIENVSGSIEGVLLFGASIFIITEAVRKLMLGTAEIEGLGIGAAVMALSAVVNYCVSRNLLNVAKKTDSIALKADALNLRTDVYTAVGVLIGLLTIKITGATILDPIIAIAVALLIVKTAYGLLKSAFLPILDVKLPDDEEAVIHEILHGYAEQIFGYHKLRTRKSGHLRHIDMHLLVPKNMTVEESHRLSHEITRQIEQQLPFSHILVHIEPCRSQCDECSVKCRVK